MGSVSSKAEKESLRRPLAQARDVSFYPNVLDGASLLVRCVRFWRSMILIVGL